MNEPQSIESLLARVRQLDEGATPGPWEVEVITWTATPLGAKEFGADAVAKWKPSKNVRTAWVHGQAKSKVRIACEAVGPYAEPKSCTRMDDGDAEWVAESRTLLPLVADRLEEAERVLECGHHHTNEAGDGLGRWCANCRDRSRHCTLCCSGKIWVGKAVEADRERDTAIRDAEELRKSVVAWAKTAEGPRRIYSPETIRLLDLAQAIAPESVDVEPRTVWDVMTLIVELRALARLATGRAQEAWPAGAADFKRMADTIEGSLKPAPAPTEPSSPAASSSEAGEIVSEEITVIDGAPAFKIVTRRKPGDGQEGNDA